MARTGKWEVTWLGQRHTALGKMAEPTEQESYTWIYILNLPYLFLTLGKGYNVLESRVLHLCKWQVPGTLDTGSFVPSYWDSKALL
jgi:hypothetical protein